MDNTQRFSDRVENYQKFRPSYTDETIDYIFHNFGLSRDSVLADVGAGTGIFTEKLVTKCKLVYAIEPNQEMRTAADKRLSSYSSYKSINGTSDKTMIGNNSIDGITVAQAFHWFDIVKTKKEFKRILKKDAYVFLIWNNRIANTPFLSAYEDVLKNKLPEYKVVNHKNITDEIINTFINKDYQKTIFPNTQTFTLDGVLGRLSSSSYTPKEDTKEYHIIKEEIINAFNQYSSGGFVEFNYNTEVYSGKIT